MKLEVVLHDLDLARLGGAEGATREVGLRVGTGGEKPDAQDARRAMFLFLRVKLGEVSWQCSSGSFARKVA